MGARVSGERVKAWDGSSFPWTGKGELGRLEGLDRVGKVVVLQYICSFIDVFTSAAAIARLNSNSTAEGLA